MSDTPLSKAARISRRRALGLTGFGVVGAVGAVGAVSSRRETATPTRQAAQTTTATENTRQQALGRRSTPTATVPPFEGIEEASVGDLGRALEGRQISAAELVEEMVARVEAMDQELDGEEGLRAIIELNPEAAAIAADLDDELARGESRGPLHGIPVLLKDTFATGDEMRTTAGALALEDNPCVADSFVAERLREAGAIILGKANLTEWSNFRGSPASSGWSGRGGQTRNPYQLTMSPWGSSSGSGVGVAASYAPLALGVETNGSIMTPASACGIVGLKPTVGLVSRRGVVPISFTQDSPGPMARSVEDAALLLSAIAGHDRQDPAYSETDWSAPANAFDKFPVPKVGKVNYTEGLTKDALKGAQIGICRSLWGNDAAADEVAEEALAVLEEAGARLVDDVSIPNQGAVGADGAGYRILLTEFVYGIERFLETYLPDGPIQSLADIREFNEANAEAELAYTDQAVFYDAIEALSIEDDFYRETVANNLVLAREEGIDAVMEELELDALIAPSAPVPTEINLYGDDFAGASTGPTASAGYPILTVPAGYVDGLPVGLSFMGQAFTDAALLRYAYAFEQALPVREAPTYRR